MSVNSQREIDIYQKRIECIKSNISWHTQVILDCEEDIKNMQSLIRRLKQNTDGDQSNVTKCPDCGSIRHQKRGSRFSKKMGVTVQRYCCYECKKFFNEEF